MSVLDTIKGLVGDDDADIDVTTYECRECGEIHDSAKFQERAQCPECLANDVEPVGE